jgi:uncharacterized protein with HEPN domain
MSKSPVELFRHILKEIDFIDRNADNIELSVFLKDDVLQHAFVRSIEIIGEAVKNISLEIKALYPEINWRKIAGTRDKMIHNYFEIDLEIVWDIIKNKLPTLKEAIQKIMINYKN